MIMNKYLLVMLSVGVLALSGCGTMNKKPKSELYPSMYSEMPKSILVLPAINQSTAADAPNLYSSTIAQPLANAGFYVLSTEVTQKFFRNEGLSRGEQFTSIPPQKFSKLFGADAVLYVTIMKWDTNYYVLGGNVTVGIKYLLKSTKTGNQLWTYENELVLDTSGNNNQGGGFLALLINAAVTTAVQDYVPIARRVNFISIGTIPFGSYHKAHGKDRNTQVYVKPQ